MIAKFLLIVCYEFSNLDLLVSEVAISKSSMMAKGYLGVTQYLTFLSTLSMYIGLRTTERQKLHAGYDSMLSKSS